MTRPMHVASGLTPGISSASASRAFAVPKIPDRSLLRLAHAGNRVPR